MASRDFCSTGLNLSSGALDYLDSAISDGMDHNNFSKLLGDTQFNANVGKRIALAKRVEDFGGSARSIVDNKLNTFLNKKYNEQNRNLLDGTKFKNFNLEDYNNKLANLRAEHGEAKEKDKPKITEQIKQLQLSRPKQITKDDTLEGYTANAFGLINNELNFDNAELAIINNPDNAITIGEQLDNNESNSIVSKLTKGFNKGAKLLLESGAYKPEDLTVQNYIPIRHEARILRKMGKDTWREYILPKLNQEYTANILKVTVDELPEVLDNIYDSITEGINNLKNASLFDEIVSGGGSGGGKKVLMFNSYKDGIEYNINCGGYDNLSQILNNYNSSVAKRIALARMFGSNPRAEIDRISRIAKDGKIFKAAMEEAYIGVPVTHPKWNDFLKNALSISSGLHALTATTSSFQDGMFVADTARKLLDKTAWGNYFFPTLKGLIKNKDEQDLANRAISGILQTFDYTNRGIYQEGLQKYVGKFAKYSNIVMHKLDESSIRAAGDMVLGSLTDNISKGFDEIPDNLRATMMRNNFTSKDWEEYQQTSDKQVSGQMVLKLRNITQEILDYSKGHGDAMDRAIWFEGRVKGGVSRSLLQVLYQFKQWHFRTIRKILQQNELLNGGKMGLADAMFIPSFLSLPAIMTGTAVNNIINNREPFPNNQYAFFKDTVLSGVFGRVSLFYMMYDNGWSSMMPPIVRDIGKVSSATQTLGSSALGISNDDIQTAFEKTGSKLPIMSFFAQWMSHNSQGYYGQNYNQLFATS